MMKLLKKILTLVLVVLIATVGGLYWLGTRDDTSTGPAATADAGTLVERGRYLAQAGNCMACHTSRGGKALAGGTPIPTPFGTVYGPNITPDEKTGIGTWTADDFWQALHNGKSKDGTLLYPAFPYTEYTRITRADADALYAYLRSVPPVSQPNRPPDMAFPYDQRALLAAWRALYFKPGVQEADAGQSVQWNRGRYLVEGLGHCAACHTPRNSLGATRSSEAFTGGIIPVLDWYAPPLTNDRQTGMGRWTAADIAALLKTGISAHSSASGPMAEVVLGSTQHLTDDDALAIGVYIKSLPATPASTPRSTAAAAPAAMELGSKIYRQHCAQCHQPQGQGSGTAWPALAGNPTVTAPSPVNAIRMVLDGGYAPATAANPRPHGMPPFGQILNDSDIAMLVSYIRNSWGNEAGGVTALEVKRARASSTLN
ncbi:Gluconate 2-dehydrogenase cytochrome c subunit precursor [Achromobacter spanius]|nr:Gluconate 2-dehydrogenase cytochrome c subunit [Achromobacter spanius]SPT36587.1 Gluconate 2-dehydrogenase cytochrome c subunit precursor [Achromobacter denitrificans]VEE56535.1 Gluconate 2-dehydrogenase cytochrome c subunit precursor [Achromobacter spanius]